MCVGDGRRHYWHIARREKTRLGPERPQVNWALSAPQLAGEFTERKSLARPRRRHIAAQGICIAAFHDDLLLELMLMCSAIMLGFYGHWAGPWS